MKRVFLPVVALWLVVASVPSLVPYRNEALAQAYPSRPVRLIMPYPAGGSGDIVGRLIAERLGPYLGQSVVVDNRPGASGLIGTALASKAAPDGYTLLFATSTNAINVTLHPKLPYDLAKDFHPVALIARALQVLVVNPSVAATSLTEFVALAKSKPGQLSYASSGSGTSGHLAMEQLKRAASIDLVHIPHKGNAPALNDLLGAQVAAMFSNVVTAIPHIRNGKLRPLGVSSLQRSLLAPDIPTIAETGFPGFEVIAWFAIMVPSGTPTEVVSRLNAEIQNTLGSREALERFLALGMEPADKVKTPEQFGEYLKADIAKWAKMIRESGIRPD